MANSSRSSSRDSVAVAVSLATAMLIAASSVKVVAAADGQAACNIEEVTVDNAAEVIKSRNEFKMTVLCANTVHRVLEKGDHCFCELISRVEAKDGSTISDSFCRRTDEISRCRGAACGIPDDDGDVLSCAAALLGPTKDTSQDPIQLQLTQEEAPFSRPINPFFQFAVRDCCSKMSKLSAACACEFRKALQKMVGSAIDLKSTLPCKAGDCAMQ
jgi:hypothetical protein